MYGGSVALDKDGSLSLSKDLTVREGVGAGGSLTLDFVTSHTWAINLLGKPIEVAEPKLTVSPVQSGCTKQDCSDRQK